MISYIKGKVLQRKENTIIVDTGTIGYLVHLSEKNIGNIRKDVELYTYMAFRRDIFELYGFMSFPEYELFCTLLTVSGIGPKAALKITALGDISDFSLAIERNDHDFFKQIKGVGKKTIQKLILELSGKFEEFKDFSKELSKDDKSVLDTLKTLGYSKQESLQAIELIPGDITKIKDKVKFALKSLYIR